MASILISATLMLWKRQDHFACCVHCKLGLILREMFCLPCYSNNLSTFDVVCNELRYLSACKALQETVPHLHIIWLALDDDILMFRTETTVAQLLPLWRDNKNEFETNEVSLKWHTSTPEYGNFSERLRVSSKCSSDRTAMISSDLNWFSILSVYDATQAYIPMLDPRIISILLRKSCNIPWSLNVSRSHPI